MVIQPFEAEADNEYVIRGNSAIMKCEVPSFVADFVSVEMWMDTDGNTYTQNSDYGNGPSCHPRVMLFLCFSRGFNRVPCLRSTSSFTVFPLSLFFTDPKVWLFVLFVTFYLFLVVQQFYQSRVSDEFVLRGNTAILKCQVPSFVADFIEVVAWVSDEGDTFITEGQEKGRLAFLFFVSFSVILFVPSFLLNFSDSFKGSVKINDLSNGCFKTLQMCSIIIKDR